MYWNPETELVLLERHHQERLAAARIHRLIKELPQQPTALAQWWYTLSHWGGQQMSILGQWLFPARLKPNQKCC